MRTVYRRARSHVSRHKLGIVRLASYGLAFGPALAMGVYDYQSKSGEVGDKLSHAMSMQLLNFSGYNLETGGFVPANLLKGWVPIGTAIAFRRIVGRYLR